MFLKKIFNIITLDEIAKGVSIEEEVKECPGVLQSKEVQIEEPVG